MLSFTKLLYSPAYRIIGVDATLLIGETLHDPIRVIDMTEGVGVGGPVDVDTVTPAATVRRAELDEKGIDPATLRDSTLTLDGVAWRVTSHQPKQSPSGAADGEVWLFLEGATE